jgi:hypothetical protein
MKRQLSTSYPSVSFLSLTMFIVSILTPRLASAQAVPYARTFAKSREGVVKALKELQANAGNKLPTVDGFIAVGDQPLNRYERAFYQFSIDLLPASAEATTVRVTAKITAWYVDPAPWKSGYQILPSNGRLELDLLDRLSEKFGEKPATSVLRSQVQAPTPKINRSSGMPGASLQLGKGSEVAAPSAVASGASASDEVGVLRSRREAEEKRMRQLTTELQTWQEVQHNQAHPPNLVVVKKTGTAVLARPAQDAHVLFAAAADDEFEFLDAEGPWIHVQISGASRGYIRRSNLELPEFIAARLKSPNGAASSEKQEAFRLEREETSTFPGDWEPLRGKSVKIYTIQPVSQDPKETGAHAKLSFALSMFQEFAAESTSAKPPLEGVVVIFDSADGGIIGSTLLNAQQVASGALSQDSFWKLCYLDPPDAFRSTPKP